MSIKDSSNLSKTTPAPSSSPESTAKKKDPVGKQDSEPTYAADKSTELNARNTVIAHIATGNLDDPDPGNTGSTTLLQSSEDNINPNLEKTASNGAALKVAKSPSGSMNPRNPWGKISTFSALHGKLQTNYFMGAYKESNPIIAAMMQGSGSKDRLSSANGGSSSRSS